MRKNKTEANPMKLINLWERIELRLKVADQSAGYVTRVEDLANNKILCECPVRLSGTLALSIGQAVEVTVNKKDASYVFEAIVAMIDSAKENLTALQPISEAKRTQRRKFVRIDIEGKVSFRILDNDDIEQSPAQLEHGSILNVSAGGILLTTTQTVKQGAYLLLNLRLNQHNRLENIIGFVKRVDTQDKEFLVGVEFLTKSQLADKQHRQLADMLPQSAHYFDDELQRHIVQYVYNHEVTVRKERSQDS